MYQLLKRVFCESNNVALLACLVDWFGLFGLVGLVWLVACLLGLVGGSVNWFACFLLGLNPVAVWTFLRSTADHQMGIFGLEAQWQTPKSETWSAFSTSRTTLWNPTSRQGNRQTPGNSRFGSSVTP